MLMRLNQGHPINRLRSEMDGLFENFFRRDFSEPFNGFGVRAFPPLNVWEDEQNVYAEAELPGTRMEDIEVTVAGNELTIKGERKDHTEEGVTYHRREQPYGAFSRIARLPLDIEADRVEANLSNGVLTVTLPKAEAVKPRTISVKALTS